MAVEDALPCRHNFNPERIDPLIGLLQGLDQSAPQLLRDAGIDPQEYPPLLVQAVERMRGSHAASTGDKNRFIEAILHRAQQRGLVQNWQSIGSQNRQDYSVTLLDGSAISVEAKGCGDGNNMNISERPRWAHEFVIWSQCPNSLAKEPGRGTWSGVANRLLPEMIASDKLVDAMIFHDGRCGSPQRPCPKQHGIEGLRPTATDIPSQDRKPTGWVPPPCIYLFPQTVPDARNNRHPTPHSHQTCRFVDMLLELFNVPQSARGDYVHTVDSSLTANQHGERVLDVTVTSRNWPDGQPRTVNTGPKTVRREA